DAGPAGSGADAPLWQAAQALADGPERGRGGAVAGDGAAWPGADSAADGVCVRSADQRTLAPAGDGHRQCPAGGRGASGQRRQGSAGAAVAALVARVAGVVVYASDQAVA